LCSHDDPDWSGTMTTFISSPSVTITTEFDIADGGRTATRNDATTLLKGAISRTPTIADQYSGLLDNLTHGQRRGLIAKLSVGYYEGWRPTRAQLARHIQEEFGVLPLGLPDNKSGLRRSR
jgi:hypothetical protein